MISRHDPPRVRLVDVALRAQCSAATVSRVLNAPESVNLEARLRVEAAVQALGYMRDGAARALRSRRSYTVGLILPTIKQPIYAAFVEALQDAVARQGYSLLVMNARFSLDQEAEEARLLAERGIDGLVLIGRTHRRELHALLEARRLPFVNTFTFKADWPDPTIGHDNVAAMEKVVAHLHDLGHRSFAILASPAHDNDRLTDRLGGAEMALASRGIDVPDDHVILADFTIAGARAGTAKALALPQRPTAIICTSDILALGVLFECAARQIAVPRSLSVTGFEDLRASKSFHPPLTSLAVPMEAMGRRVAEHLLARIDGLERGANEELETTLVVRETTAPPP